MPEVAFASASLADSIASSIRMRFRYTPVVRPNGPTEIATVGDSVPGRGTFFAFGPWPSLGSDNMVVFMAGIEDGLGPLLFHAAGSLGLRRIAMVGDRLTNGRILQAFALNPVASAASNGGLTFATVAELGGGGSSIYYFGP